MPIKKLKDWSGWWDGLRSKAMRAGAESVVTNLTALTTTNAIAGMGIDALKDIGMNWKTFLITMALQFLVRVGLSAALYVQNKPDPDIITVTEETTFVTQDASTGVKTGEGSIKTTTTTPVAPEPPKE